MTSSHALVSRFNLQMFKDICCLDAAGCRFIFRIYYDLSEQWVLLETDKYKPPQCLILNFINNLSTSWSPQYILDCHNGHQQNLYCFNYGIVFIWLWINRKCSCSQVTTVFCGLVLVWCVSVPFISSISQLIISGTHGHNRKVAISRFLNTEMSISFFHSWTILTCWSTLLLDDMQLWKRFSLFYEHDKDDRDNLEEHDEDESRWSTLSTLSLTSRMRHSVMMTHENLEMAEIIAVCINEESLAPGYKHQLEQH